MKKLQTCLHFTLTSVHLHSAQSQRSAHSKQSSQNRESVNKISHPPVYPVSDKGIETRLHRHRKSLPERHESHYHAYQDVDNPPMDTPMEVRQVHGPLRHFIVGHVLVFGVSVGSNVVVDRLCDSVEEQTHADTTSKQHGKPGAVAVLWRFIILAWVETRFTSYVICVISVKRITYF